MSLIKFFQEVVTELTKRKIQFALVGGMIASVYRNSPRATDDLDFLIFTKSDPQKTAKEIIKHFDLVSHELRKADLEGGPLFAIKKKSTAVYIVAGRPTKRDSNRIGLDFILPTIPWADEAIKRAQDNPIDFGFESVPCLTVEDMIISKLYAVTNQTTRFMDMDDLKSIFESDLQLDTSYLCAQMVNLELKIPDAIKSYAPKEVQLISKKIKNKK